MRPLSKPLLSFFVAGLLSLPVNGLTEEGDTSGWLPTLQTDTPEQGFELAVKLSRRGVKTTQPDVEVLKEGRKTYSKDADTLIKASEVIAVHFRTISAANNYWRED